MDIWSQYKNTNNDKYDMLTNKSSKLLFYNFKNYLNRRGQTRTKSNTYNYIWGRSWFARVAKKYWSYFMGKRLEFSEKENSELENNATKTETVENELLLITNTTNN